MDGSNRRQCLQCGKRALSIATRCPGCGCEFPALPVPAGAGGRELDLFVTPRGIGVVLAAVAVLASARLGQTSQPGEAQSGFVAAGMAPAMAPTAPPDPATAAAPTAESASELRVVRTWTHVRKSRSVSAALEGILVPGDTVLADSLERGWYRVALEGEVLGYAHRSTLGAAGTPQ